MKQDHEAVKIWRDIFKLNLNQGFKSDIEVTVKDLEAWRDLLIEWKEKKWNPLNIKFQLSEYERRARKKPERRSNGSDRAVSESRTDEKDVSTRVPERRNGNLSDMREGTGIHARTDNPNLDEILARALRAANRSEK